MLLDGHDAVVVDPGDAAPVLNALARDQLKLAAILVTHHHRDHTGGVAALRQATGATVYGPARESIPQPCTGLKQGDQITVLGLRLEVLDVPGHTAGHIAYYLPADQDKEAAAELAPLVFCGDTLFSGGCGRLFEGTPAQMLRSLDTLAALPGTTRVCSAHEYTLSNLRFAQAVEPENTEIAEYIAYCETQRSQGEPTLPSHIATERLINPFLRSREACVTKMVRQHAGLDAAASPVEVFAALRQWKNQF